MRAIASQITGVSIVCSSADQRKHQSSHYRDVIMSTMASQITSFMLVYSTVYSRVDQRKYQLRVTGFWEGNSPVTGEFPAQRASDAENVSIWWRHHAASLAFVGGIPRWPVDSPHKGSVTQKMFLFDDVIMFIVCSPSELKWALTEYFRHPGELPRLG